MSGLGAAVDMVASVSKRAMIAFMMAMSLFVLWYLCGGGYRYGRWFLKSKKRRNAFTYFIYKWEVGWEIKRADNG